MKRPPAQIPTGARRGLVGGAVLLVVVAAAVNIAHTRTNAIDHGADSWTASVVGLIPDVLLVLSVMRLRYDLRSLWAWAGVTGAVALVGWSALATAGGEHGAGGRVIALVCLAAAIVATGQAHVRHGEDPAVTMAHLEALADDTARTARLEVDAARADAGAAVRDAVDELARTVSDAEARAAADAARLEDLAAALAASQDALRAAQETARQAVPDTAADARAKAPGRRPATARKAPAGRTDEHDDVQRRRTARDGYKASVRAKDPWSNHRLGCALAGCTDACVGDEHRPLPDILVTARKRASDWRREVDQESERGAQDDTGDAHPDATGTAR